MELAEIAYNAYGDCRDWKVFSGDPMPRWEEQQEGLRVAWRAAVDAVKMVIEMKETKSGETS